MNALAYVQGPHASEVETAASHEPTKDSLLVGHYFNVNKAKRCINDKSLFFSLSYRPTYTRTPMLILLGLQTPQRARQVFISILERMPDQIYGVI